MPRDADEPEVPTSLICEGLRINGDLKSDGHIHIDGAIEGNVRVTSVIVGEKGSIEGNVVADILDVHGFVSGNIAARVVKLRSTAHVIGDTMHEELFVEKGACVDGRFSKRPITEQHAQPINTPETAPGGF
jgi:cytoskeletal protein CcmA (bactofilin family)